jgi:hypothetical protein
VLSYLRVEEDARYLQALFDAERTRNTLLDEERTRLHYHRFSDELAQLRAERDAKAAALTARDEELTALARRTERLEGELRRLQARLDAAQDEGHALASVWNRLFPERR